MPTATVETPLYWTLERTAKEFHVSTQTFAGWWKSQPGFPQPLKVGRRLLFCVQDIAQFRQVKRKEE
jgi:hypothetical protein